MTSSPTGLWLSVLHLAANAAEPDVHLVHAAVANLFDGLPWPIGARPLWSMPRPDTLVVQGPVRLRPADTPWVSEVTSTLVTIPEAGVTVSLSSIANPVKAAREHAADPAAMTRGQRTALDDAERPAWLLRHLAGAVDTPLGRIGGRRMPTAHGLRPAGNCRVTIARHLFHATGTVTDPDALRRLVLAGIGPAKGYGCGLLLVREVGG